MLASSARIAITTRSSTRVKPWRAERVVGWRRMVTSSVLLDIRPARDVVALAPLVDHVRAEGPDVVPRRLVRTILDRRRRRAVGERAAGLRDRRATLDRLGDRRPLA